MPRMTPLWVMVLGIAALPVVPAAAADLGASAAKPTPSVADNAYQLNLLYTGEIWDNTSGGVRQGVSYMNNIDAQLSIDTGKAFGWTGGTFVLEGFYANGVSTGNSYVGALDQQSPIDTAAGSPMLRLYQVYYDQVFGSTDVRFGIYDLETEFSNTKPMALFLSKDLTWNTALDQSGLMPQNGTVGPGNYPYTPLALRVRQNFGNQFSVQVAVADGAADNPNHLPLNGVEFSSHYGAMIMAEADYTPSKFDKFMAGVWTLTSKLPVYGQLTGGLQKMTYGETGAYVGGAMRLYAQTPKRGLDGFFTLGVSQPQSTNAAESFNAGFTYTGLLDSRPTDKVGISMNANFASSYWKQASLLQGTPLGNTELSYEVTYRAKINEYLTMQPDVQYIVNPNYNHAIKNDLLVGLHFEVGHVFEW